MELQPPTLGLEELFIASALGLCIKYTSLYFGTYFAFSVPPGCHKGDIVACDIYVLRIESRLIENKIGPFWSVRHTVQTKFLSGATGIAYEARQLESYIITENGHGHSSGLPIFISPNHPIKEMFLSLDSQFRWTWEISSPLSLIEGEEYVQQGNTM